MTVLVIKLFKGALKKLCIQTKMEPFFYIIYTLIVWIQQVCLACLIFALVPRNSVIRRLWCMCWELPCQLAEEIGNINELTSQFSSFSPATDKLSSFSEFCKKL